MPDVITDNDEGVNTVLVVEADFNARHKAWEDLYGLAFREQLLLIELEDMVANTKLRPDEQFLDQFAVQKSQNMQVLMLAMVNTDNMDAALAGVTLEEFIDRRSRGEGASN